MKERNRENWKYILPLSCCDDELRMKKERESEVLKQTSRPHLKIGIFAFFCFADDR